MATPDAAQGEPAAFQSPVFADGGNAVIGARGCKPATARKIRADAVLVRPDEENENAFHGKRTLSIDQINFRQVTHNGNRVFRHPTGFGGKAAGE